MHMARTRFQYIWLKSVKMRYVAKYLFPGNVAFDYAVCTAVQYAVYVFTWQATHEAHFILWSIAYTYLGFHLISIP